MFCADPFRKHKHKETQFVQKVPEDLVKKVNNPMITEDTYLCLNCRKALKKNPLALSSVAAQQNTGDETESVYVSSSEAASAPASDNTSLEEIVMGAEATEKVQDVLRALDQSPMRLSKCNVCI